MFKIVYTDLYLTMKKFYLLFLFVFSFVSVYCQIRKESDALAIANRFFNERLDKNLAKESVQPERVYVQFADGSVKRSMAQIKESPAFYIYNKNDEAFVIVSGDERMPEVLAYSENNIFGEENIPDNVRYWLAFYEEAYCALENGRLSIEPSYISKAGMASSVSPLLGEINYNQDAPYNNLCPEYRGSNCYTGCVATAIASIMKYYEYPKQGTGTNSYTTRTYKLNCSFDFGNTVFDWDNILDTYNNRETEKQKNAVATLMKACGVAMNMDYTDYGSGAYSNDIPENMSKYLGYNPNMIYVERDYFQSAEWISLLKNELNENRPVYYSGSSNSGGHAFVLDGYDENGLFHVNWGWGGYCNGYFELLTLAPNGSGIGGGTDLDGYRFGQAMVLKFQPEETEAMKYYLSADCIEFNKEYVKKGESFKVSISSMFNKHKGLDYEIGFLLEKDSDLKVISRENVRLEKNYGWETFTTNLSIPSNCEDGVYKLYCATRSNGDTEWTKVRYMAWEAEEVYVEVKGSDCRIFKNLDLMPDLSVNFVQNGGLTVGGKGDFTATISNNGGKEFYGELSLLLVTEDMSEIVSVISTEMYSIDAKESKVVNFNFDLKMTNEYNVASNIPAGNYNLVMTKNGKSVVYSMDNVLGVTISLPGLDFSNMGVVSFGVKAGEDFRLSGVLRNSGNTDFNGTCNLSVQGESILAEENFTVSVPAGGEYDLSQLSVNTAGIATGTYSLVVDFKEGGNSVFSSYVIVTVVADSDVDVYFANGGLNKSVFKEGEKILLDGQVKALGTGKYDGYYAGYIYNSEGEIVKNSNPVGLSVSAGQAADISLNLSTFDMLPGTYDYVLYMTGKEGYFVNKMVFTLKIVSGTPVSIELSNSKLSADEAAIGDELSFTINVANKGTGKFDGYCAGAFVADNSILQSFGRKNVIIEGGRNMNVQIPVEIKDIEPGVYSFNFLIAHSLDEQYYGYYVCDVTVKDKGVSIGEVTEIKEPVICSASSDNDIRLVSGIRIDRIDVYDYSGKKVYASELNGAIGTVSIPGDNIRGGVYIIEVKGTDNSRFVLKAIRD